MAASRRRNRWWRSPVLRRGSRRRAEGFLVLTALVSLALGSGAGAAVRAVATTEEEPVPRTTLGPVQIALPDDAGPWALASERASDAIRAAADGPVEIDGAWGALGADSVVVTVLTAAPGTHGGVAQFGASVPAEEPAAWAGDREHAAGAEVSDGVREMVLVVAADDGALVILSVCGPVAAFESGSLAEAFRTARVG